MERMFDTKLFNEIYENSDSFLSDYAQFQTDFGDLNKVDNKYIKLTWQLLSAKFGNNPIANLSENQFKLKIWQIIFQYGPTWVKKLDIQQSLRNTSIEDFREGYKSIENQAFNPDQEPSTDEINFVSQQRVNKNMSGLLSTYGNLWALLKSDVNGEYLDRFNNLFLKVVIPQAENIYATYYDEV